MLSTAIRSFAGALIVALAAASAQAAATLSIFVSDGDTDNIPCEAGDCSFLALMAPGNVIFDVFLTVGPEGVVAYDSEVLTFGAGTAVSATGANPIEPSRTFARSACTEYP